jgi:hypothetical protein
MSVGSTELVTGVGSTEPAVSGGAGFAGAGAGTERRRRLRRRWSGNVMGQPKVGR